MSDGPAAPARDRSGPGLRLQIILALAGIILVAYVPLFFAIAQVTRGTSIAYRVDAARSLGRAVAAHVADVRTTAPSDSGKPLPRARRLPPGWPNCDQP